VTYPSLHKIGLFARRRRAHPFPIYRRKIRRAVEKDQEKQRQNAADVGGTLSENSAGERFCLHLRQRRNIYLPAQRYLAPRRPVLGDERPPGGARKPPRTRRSETTPACPAVRAGAGASSPVSSSAVLVGDDRPQSTYGRRRSRIPQWRPVLTRWRNGHDRRGENRNRRHCDPTYRA
jgi:hypothetical protein